MSAPSESMAINPRRGEVALDVAGARWRLVPRFAALAAAEAELGSLFALIERASAGELRLVELVALFWHCLDPRPETLTRAAFADALAAAGLARLTPAYKALALAILGGSA
ncbi:GTA-gp10 family protein [Parapedomonas caeni]